MTAASPVLLDARPRDLGGFSVGRVLPTPGRRMVGPFIFFDHMGPAVLAPGRGIDVRPHPHIGLATVTYLFEGEIVHTDSLGVRQAITPGAVNWMTAGRGIVHAERTGPSERARGPHLHGLQLWVALPKAHEEVEPSFHHHAADTLPAFHDGGAHVRVLAGSAFGRASPVQTLSPLVYVDVALEAGASLALPTEVPERALYVVEGDVACSGLRLRSGQMIVLAEGAPAEVTADAAARVVLVGGEPLAEPRHIWWNFVSSRPERIEEAKHAWSADAFARVPGDPERIPLPEDR